MHRSLISLVMTLPVVFAIETTHASEKLSLTYEPKPHEQSSQNHKDEDVKRRVGKVILNREYYARRQSVPTILSNDKRHELAAQPVLHLEQLHNMPLAAQRRAAYSPPYTGPRRGHPTPPESISSAPEKGRKAYKRALQADKSHPKKALDASLKRASWCPLLSRCTIL